MPTKPEIENYTYVIDKINYFKLFGNNVIITVTGIAGIVLFSSAAAYMLDRRRNRYTRIAHLLIITPMLIPFQTIMITLLKAMNVIHLSGSKLGLGVQYWGFGIPMATFIFYNFMKTIPRELDESAKIDGASTHVTFFKVIFPLLKSVTVTVIVLDVMWIWNDFLLPLLMVNSSNETKTLVLVAYTFVRTDEYQVALCHDSHGAGGSAIHYHFYFLTEIYRGWCGSRSSKRLKRIYPHRRSDVMRLKNTCSSWAGQNYILYKEGNSMKKKLVSVLLSTAMVAGVFSGLGISASAGRE